GTVSLAASAVGGTLYLGAGATVTAAGFTQSNSVASPPTLTVEIGGTATSQFGQLVSTMGITLGTGSTLNTRLVNGFMPTAGQTFQILSAATTVSGTYATTNLQGQPGVSVGATYNAANVTLTAAATSTVTWTGGAGDGKWTSAGNWSGGVVPGASSDVVIPGGAGTVLYDSFFTAFVNSITALSPVNINTTSEVGIIVA